MNNTVTELEVVELTEETYDLECEWCVLWGETAPASVYLRRPACPCFPQGKVFPACAEWATRHLGFAGFTACCGMVYRHEEIKEVGRIH